jgi:hypothetical protein
MKKLILLSIFIIIIVIIITSFSCRKEPDNVYYSVEGDGYAYDRTTHEPIKTMLIMQVHFVNRGMATKAPMDIQYFSDTNGYFRIKFPERISRTNVTWYDIFGWKSISAEKIKQAKETIHFDTIYH